MKLAAALCFCTFTCLAVGPAWGETTIEPRARQIFARAATRYGNANTLRLRWRDADNEQFEKGGDEMGFARGEVAFDRRGLLRWQSTAQSSRYSLVVVDGKTTSRVLSERVNLRPYPVYEQQTGRGRQVAFEQLRQRGEWFPTLAQWLQGISPLSRRSVSKMTDSAKVVRYTAKVLPTAKLNNKPCDLVRIEVKYRDKKFTQETYWFQKGEGQILRIQRNSGLLGNQVSDIRIESQQFNPKFTETTFRFVSPKRAKLVAGN